MCHSSFEVKQNVRQGAWVLAFRGVMAIVSPQSDSEGKCVTVPGLESPCLLELFSR